MYEENLPTRARMALRQAMKDSARMASADDRAWAMRRGLDQAAMVLVASTHRKEG